MAEPERERVIEREPSAAYVKQLETENLAAQSRPMRDNETISGEVVAEIRDKSGKESYLVETSQGDIVAIPKGPDADFSKGDEIEATRTDGGYDVSADNGYGR